MADSGSRNFSLGAGRSISSDDFSSAAGSEDFRSRGDDLAQAMLAEIEEMLKEYDMDLKTLCSQSQGARDFLETNVKAEENEASSFETTSGQSGFRHTRGRPNLQLRKDQSTEIQTVNREVRTDRGPLNMAIRNIYKLLSTGLAPKLQALMREVAGLRRNNESLADKVEHQRKQNDKQLEEFEELLSELRAKDRQLHAQKRIQMNLDICQGENAMLKTDLKNLRARLNKLVERKSAHTDVHTPQEKAELVFKKAPSTERLKKENEDLQREVSRWKAEISEKEVMITEMRGVIKRMTTGENAQGKIPASHYRPESPFSPQPPPARGGADSPVESRAGGALTSDRQRGRFRSIAMDNIAPVVCPATTTLAEDLGVKNLKAMEPSNGQNSALLFQERRNRRGSLVPPAMFMQDAWGVRKRSSSADDTVNAENNLTRRLGYTSEAMERALLELEEVNASRRREALELESKIAHLEQLLMQAEERILVSVEDMEGLRNDRISAIAEQRLAQEKLESVTTQLRESLSKVAELQTTIDRLQATLDFFQRDATHAASVQAQSCDDSQKTTSEEKVASFDGKLLPVCSTEEPRIAKPPDEPAQHPSVPLSERSETKEKLQHARIPLPPEKLKVVLRKKADCSSLWTNCFKLCNASTSLVTSQKLYSLEPPAGIGGGMWSSRKPRIFLQAAANPGK